MLGIFEKEPGPGTQIVEFLRSTSPNAIHKYLHTCIQVGDNIGYTILINKATHYIIHYITIYIL